MVKFFNHLLLISHTVICPLPFLLALFVRLCLNIILAKAVLKRIYQISHFAFHILSYI